MWTLLLKETRSDTSVPYFRQHPGDLCAWFGHIEQLYASLSPRLQHYNVRFSPDLLTRYVLTTFEDEQDIRYLRTNSWFRLRQAAFEIYCQSRNIIHENILVQHDNRLAMESYMMSIVSETLPRSSVLVTDAFMPNVIATDRVINQAVQDDTWELHPWFLNCIKP